MKRLYLIALFAVMSVATAFAQYYIKMEGKCGIDVRWSYDGHTLSISNVNKKGELRSIANYDTQNLAPWNKKKLAIKRVRIGADIDRIGSCAFNGCKDLEDITFETNSLTEIGWGAFMGCSNLHNLSLPYSLKKIETIAFANCTSINAISIPAQCNVEDQAFVSCTNIQSLNINPTAVLGRDVFVTEVNIAGKVGHNLYNKEVRSIPAYINQNNCVEYGLAPTCIEGVAEKIQMANYDLATADVDTIIPETYRSRNNYYAIIIGNENYRFVSKVPYAIHDAHVFKEYCEKTLGIPVQNIHVTEDATKQMILEEELEWAAQIPDRENKTLIVYYAGHGVPDIQNKNKAYLLPTDVRGTKPTKGIALDDFYAHLGTLAFQQTTVFLDACFSGINRNNEGVTEGLRGVEIMAEDGSLSDGNVVVFSAAQGNETAQGYAEMGHGLFTYYLLKELQDSNGSIRFGALADNLKRSVSEQALKMKMRKSQTPSCNVSENMSQNWRNVEF